MFKNYNNLKYSISIIQMIRKSPTTKSTKATSKSKYCDTEKYPWQLANESIVLQWRKQFSRLQQAINSQTSKRLESENQILSMIKHLQQTKKSKIPLNLEIFGLNRIKSPFKIKKSFEESQVIQSAHKTHLTEAKSEKHSQAQINQLKTKKIQNEIQSIGQKMFVIDSLSQKISQFSDQIDQVKRNNAKLSDQISEQIITLKSENESIKSCLLEIKNRVSLELRQDLESFNCEIKATVFKIVQMFNKKIETNAAQTQQNLKLCLKKLQNIGNTTALTLNSLEQKVKSASDSINQTKETIEFTLNGCESKKILQESNSYVDWNPQSALKTQKRPNEVLQTLQFVQKRVDSFERRIDLLYHDYLSRPFHRV